MAIDSEWSLDYCLTCDKQTTEGAYCSQACRRKDWEASEISSSSASSSRLSSFCSSSITTFSLPPPLHLSNITQKSNAAAADMSFDPMFEKKENKRASISSLSSLRTTTSSPQTSATSPTVSSTPVSPESREQLARYEGFFKSSRLQQQRTLSR